MEALGKSLVALAFILALAGGVLWLLGRSGGGLLPGDIVARRGSFTFVFPIATMILASAVLTLVLNVFFRR